MFSALGLILQRVYAIPILRNTCLKPSDWLLNKFEPIRSLKEELSVILLLICIVRIVCEGLGLVVMGGDSHSNGREFKSRHHILDGHFSHTYLW